MYACTGFCNVVAYGQAHCSNARDVFCWRRRRSSSTGSVKPQAGHGSRFVMFTLNEASPAGSQINNPESVIEQEIMEHDTATSQPSSAAAAQQQSEAAVSAGSRSAADLETASLTEAVNRTAELSGYSM
eukprot:TRINITY_DN1513_c0_g1_i2.p4 TRINITY_DN1513_c0_g1~~TRINITY_DN1513_c0_g1_i2.p4  ORF type:complete len:129 (-),score=17.44 TRINITY_DN1513_c0_g1_i2:90-476(-)